jgi:hypothetical protein
MLAQKLHIHARLRIKSFRVRTRDHVAEVFVARFVFAEQNEMVAGAFLCARFISARAVCNVYLATDYGLYALFFACFIEIYRTEHRAVVGYGDGAVPHGGGNLRYFRDAARAVEQAVFRV